LIFDDDDDDDDDDDVQIGPTLIVHNRVRTITILRIYKQSPTGSEGERPPSTLIRALHLGATGSRENANHRASDVGQTKASSEFRLCPVCAQAFLRAFLLQLHHLHVGPHKAKAIELMSPKCTTVTWAIFP